MRSCLYEGWVWHRRRLRVRHRFRYRLAALYLDLDEIQTAFAGGWLWSATGPALIRFRRDDYLGDAHQPLREAVDAFLAAHGRHDLVGPVQLLTQPRYFGYVINPVSLYFCHTAGGQLGAVIAEVTNTPWGERHAYLLAAPDGGPLDGPTRPLAKQLHVSPFLPLTMEYRCRIHPPGAQLRVQIASYRSGRRQFVAGLSLRRRPWPRLGPTPLLWRYPLMTHRIALGIYAQALRLWWKGATYYPHPPAAAGTLEPKRPFHSLELKRP
jgi:hypothetical protein